LVTPSPDATSNRAKSWGAELRDYCTCHRNCVTVTEEGLLAPVPALGDVIGKAGKNEAREADHGPTIWEGG